MSITSSRSPVGRGACGGRAEVGQARLLVAVEDPGVEAEARRARRRANSRAVGRVAHRGGHHGRRCARRRASRSPRRTAPSTANTRSLRLLAERAGGVDALAQPGDDRAPLDLGRRASASTSAISSRVEFVPMSTIATRVSWPGGASARRPARRAGCRRRARSSCGASARSPSRCGGRRAGSAPRSSGWSAGSGSGSVTSSAAPAIARSCSARSSAAGSTIGPRAVLTSSAVGFMRASAGLVDQVAGLGRQRAVQRHEVRALEQLLERYAARARAVEDLHPEALRPPRDRLADAAEADDAERRAGHLGAEVAVGLERHPLALAHVALALGQPAGERQQQREGEVGGRVGEHVGRVADGDAARASRPRGRRCRCRPRSWRSRAARGAASSSASSTVSVSRLSSPSASATCSRSSSGVGGSRCGHTSTSCAAIRRSSAGPGMRRVTKQRAIARRRILVARVARMSARLTLLLALVGAARRSDRSRSAATKNGITPTSPEGRATDPGREAPDHEGPGQGPGQVYVHVCKSKKKDADGLICSKEAIKRAKKKAAVQRQARRSSTSPSSGSTRRAPTTGRRTASRARAAT